jgi:hypothetical protein
MSIFVQEFMEEIFMGIRQDQLEFAEEAFSYISDMKAAGCFKRPFHLMLLKILEWCDQPRDLYDEKIDE